MKSLRFAVQVIAFLVIIVLLAGLSINIIGAWPSEAPTLSNVTPVVTSPTAEPQKSPSTERATTSTPTPRVYFATPILGPTYTPTPVVTLTPTLEPAVQVISDEPLLSDELLLQMGIGERESVWVEDWLSTDEMVLRVGYHPNSTFWAVSVEQNQTRQIDWQESQPSSVIIEELRQLDEQIDNVHISPSGRWAVWKSGKSLLAKQLETGNPPFDLLDNAKYEYFLSGSGRLRWSFQNDKLAYVVENGNLHRYEIRINDLVTSEKTIIPLEDSPPADIAWSRNEQYLLFKMLEEPQSGVENLYIVEVGKTDILTLLAHGQVNGPIHWSPTKNAIVYTNKLDRQPWLVKITQ